MNQDQFRKLLDTYGASETNWPAESRPGARALLERDEAASRLLREYRAFDDVLDRYQIDIDVGELTGRIMAAVPGPLRPGQTRKSLPDRILDWLMPADTSPRNLWRPAVAASLPLLLGVAIGSAINFDDMDPTDSWQDEIYLLALASEESEPLP